MDWARASELLAPAQTVIAVTHVFPDGDALGSLLGLTWVLRRLGKQVIPAVDGGAPANFAFLPGAEDVAASFNGNITLVVPAGASAAFEASTHAGRIDNEFGPLPRDSARTAAGKRLEFEIGGGTAEVSIDTFSGSIEIRKG